MHMRVWPPTTSPRHSISAQTHTRLDEVPLCSIYYLLHTIFFFFCPNDRTLPPRIRIRNRN